MICERCQDDVGARRPYKRDLAGALPAKNVCYTCFDELMEVAKAIRDASGVIAWAVVGEEAPPPIRMFDGTEELQLTHADVEEAR
jgi:hypothetical protein